MCDALKQKMNENTILKMNVKNYEKFHDIKFALDATKEQIKEKNKNLNENIKAFKRSGSQGALPEISMIINLNKNENKYSINNNFKKIDTLNNKSKQLSNYKNKSVKISKRIGQSLINNKSINNNYLSDINNNYKFYKNY